MKREEKNEIIVIGIAVLAIALFSWATITLMMPLGVWGNLITVVVGVVILAMIFGLDKLLVKK